jgi:hypothetical protein
MVMLNYIGASGVEQEGEEVDTHTAQLIAAYPVNRYLGFEVAVPWTYTDVDAPGTDEDRFGHLHASVHGAAYFTEHFVAGLSLCVGIPIDDRNEGEHDKYHAGSTLSIGFYTNFIQIVLNGGIEMPVDSDTDEKELKYGAYIIVGSFFDVVDIIGEFSGETVLGGEEEEETSLFLAPGFRIYPFGHDSLNLGCGVEFPVYNGERDIRFLVSLGFHL